MSEARLIFVYNADSGLFNTLTDIAHKAFSPQTYQCSLCAITHDLLSEKSEWKTFIASLPVESEFLHRDEFRKKYHGTADAYPAVYIERDGELSLVLSSDALASLDSVEALEEHVRRLI